MSEQVKKIKPLEFRTLRAEEIDVRVASVNEKGFSILLYKDARCDMNILDETVGALGWKRSHSRENANCTVEIWDQDKEQWIGKEDTGTESFTEKAKGLASDSFKRSCFNWGIGRELYTAPFIWIRTTKGEVYDTGKKTKYNKVIWSVDKKLKLHVSKITYKKDSKEIDKIEIKDNNGKVRFGGSTKKSSDQEVQNETERNQLIQEINVMLTDNFQVLYNILQEWKVDELTEMTLEQARETKGRLLKGNK
jgi:hypothetical protein